ncbi:MAG: hypothetical protein HRT89_14925 [Lentisphaeria bacterium]|nr:hypothetical protein [Lentisphaeria bacterium]NQZ69353.1 hypothetical protein [Lentisphaeria bacterium]
MKYLLYIFIVIYGCSCNIWKTDGKIDRALKKYAYKKKNKVISIHEFSFTNNGQKAMKEIFLPDNKDMANNRFYIAAEPIITSAYISVIKLYPTKNGYGLMLHTNQLGKNLWTHASEKHLGKQLVIMIDNEYKGYVNVKRIEQRGIIFLPGPYPKDEAKKILHEVRNNYVGYNK